MGRVALVTGGTRGIGAAISNALKGAGRDVIAAYAGNEHRAREFEESTGIKTVKFDVSDFDQVEAAMEMFADSENFDEEVNFAFTNDQLR